MFRPTETKTAAARRPSAAVLGNIFSAIARVVFKLLRGVLVDRSPVRAMITFLVESDSEILDQCVDLTGEGRQN